MRRLISLSLVLVVAVGAAACGGGAGRTRPRREVVAAITRAASQSREFVYTENLVQPKREIVVTGRAQDDLRLRAMLAVNGKNAIEMIASDDALAVRVADQAVAARFLTAIARQDKKAGDALKAGQWILDHQGAPPLLAPRTSENTIAIGENPLLDGSVYTFQYLRDALDDVESVDYFNPDAVDYNPLDDPWTEDAELELEDRGVRRYDTILPPLPRPTQRGTAGALPGTPHFRKMAFYLEGRDLRAAKEQILITDRPEFRRAEAGRAAEYYIRLRAQALAGATRDPVRQRELNYEITPADDIKVELPVGNVVSVTSIDVSAAVGAMFPAETRGADDAARDLSDLAPRPPGASPGATFIPAPRPGATVAP